MAERLVVFDVCDTLYDSNTTADFVRFAGDVRENPWPRAAHLAATRRVSPIFWAGAALYATTGLDLGRAVLLAGLRGIARDELRRLADRFVADVLAERRIAETHRRLRAARRRGDEVVLASTSIDPVVDAVGDALEVEAISSQLAYDGAGRCLGRLAVDRTGRKLAALSERLDAGIELTVVTDNATDRELLEAADRPVVVLRRAHDRLKWGNLEAEYLEPTA